ncbi:alpha/beta hydrolase [Actinoalloteichus caeruleus]|uniref:alpha/beta hydrolase n=1 Tax=Actinoalloteichus cyanogriseus TaxID=2893586 RepID=UPI0009DF8426|nr:alpha/beta hydrolase [Actinoalloteichus caeruleus]
MHPRSSARARVGVAATALLVPLAGCVAPESEPSAPPTSPTPSGLEAFHDQELAWEECDEYATTSTESSVYALSDGLECARLEVPLDYDEPGGRTIHVAVLRLPASGDAVGSLVTNPGGPGGSGLFGAAFAALTLKDSPLTERFDLVGLDPRGVGASTPAIDCYSDEEADRGAVPLTAQGTTAQFTEEDTRRLVERCAEGSGGLDVLAHVGTRDAARDIDVLRAVLGDDELTFLGQSYGTRLGAVYAEQFPQNVRAMLLDGAGDPTQGTVERRVSAYAGFQAAFDRMAARCAEREDCPLGPDPDRATEVFQDLVQPLYDDPVPALDAELGFDEAIGGVITGLYTEDAWPRIIAGIAEIEDGRGDELLQMNHDFGGRDPEGRWTNFAEANYAINCLDEDRLTPEEGGRLRTAIHEAAPFMDPGVDVTGGARDTCEHWPAEPNLGFPYAQDIEGLPDTLVVSITGDPTTPHAGAQVLADSLGSALLTVEGEGHGIVNLGTNPCVDEIAAEYLINLQVPAEGATCSL